MTIDEIKDLMKAEEVVKAQRGFSDCIKDALNLGAAVNIKRRKSYASRVMVCVVSLLLATGFAAVAETEFSLLWDITLDAAQTKDVLYEIASLADFLPDYCKDCDRCSSPENCKCCVLSADYCKSYAARIVFDAGGGSGQMSSKRVSLSECKYNSYVLPSCSFFRSGYRFAGWKLSSAYADSDGRTIDAGATIDLMNWLKVGYDGTLTLTATWQWTGLLESNDGFSTYAQAKTFLAALYSGSRPIGIVTVKTSKIKKNGDVRLSGYVQMIDGKKIALRPTFGNGLTGSISATLASANGASATILISEGGLSGDFGGYPMVATSTGIGGELYKSASFDFGAMPDKIDGYPISYPNANEPVQMNGARWSCAKAASVKWVKCTSSAVCGYGSWEVNDANNKTNVSGLKLSYNARQGTFKGSFKIFTSSPGGKAHTASVVGIVIDGVGYGTASVKKYNINWPITVH